MNCIGSFGLTSNIKTHVFSYPSTLRDDERPLKSLLDLLCKDKFDYKPYTVVLLSTLINLCLNFDHVYQYIARLPSPSYMHAHYFEWMDHYLIDFNA
jgi:hypothetical protein